MVPFSLQRSVIPFDASRPIQRPVKTHTAFSYKLKDPVVYVFAFDEWNCVDDSTFVLWHECRFPALSRQPINVSDTE